MNFIIFRNSTTMLTTKVCWFLSKNLSNFVFFSWNSTTCIAIACTIKLLRHNNINATLSRIWPQFKAAASVPPCIIHIVCKYSDSLCKRENGKSKEGSRKLYLLRTMSRCHSVLELHFVNSKDTTFLVKNGKNFPKLSWKKLNSLFGK